MPTPPDWEELLAESRQAMDRVRSAEASGSSRELDAAYKGQRDAIRAMTTALGGASKKPRQGLRIKSGIYAGRGMGLRRPK